MLKKRFGMNRKTNRAKTCDDAACTVDNPLAAAFRGAGATEGAGGCCEPD